MHFLLESKFELKGVFEGLEKNAEGKRRLRLRVEGKVLELKLPKELRKQYVDRLRPGAEILVGGLEQRRMFKEAKRVISRIWILSMPSAQPAACVKCPIRVCSKKNCWKSGGKQLWNYLENRIEEEGLGDIVELRAVGCLKNCDNPPNIAYNRKVHGCCSRQYADRILEEIASKHRKANPVAESKEFHQE